MKSPNALLIAMFSTATFWPPVANARAFTSKEGLDISTLLFERPDKDDPSKNFTYTVMVGVSPNAYNFTNGSSDLVHKRMEVGPSPENPDFALNARDMEEAMRCLQVEFCRDRDILPAATISCTVGDMMAYVCNHVSPVGTVFEKFASWAALNFHTGGIGHNPCALGEMQEKWAELKKEKNVDLGWWYEKDWKKLYGWDKAGAEVCGNLDFRQWQFRMTCQGCECDLWEDVAYDEGGFWK